jgi:hypothetical protein
MVVVFLAYYGPEQYKLLLQYSHDRKKLDDKWEDWLVQYIKAKSSLTKNFTVEEIDVDVRKMNEYFKSKKLKNNSANRATYVSELGARSHEQRLNN